MIFIIFEQQQEQQQQQQQKQQQKDLNRFQINILNILLFARFVQIRN